MKINTTLYKVSSLILFALVVVTGTIAYTKAEGNQITVCVKKNGLMYVIGGEFKKKDCKHEDSLFSWNTAGTQGPKGDIGDTGPQGLQGEFGPTGPQGVAGTNGNQYHLYDLNNQDLGIILKLPGGGDNSYSTLLPDVKLSLNLRDGGFDNMIIADGPVEIRYSGTDCTGESFALVGRPLTLLLGWDGNNYVNTQTTATARTTLSSISSSGACKNFNTPELNQSTFLVNQIHTTFSGNIVKPLHIGF